MNKKDPLLSETSLVPTSTVSRMLALQRDFLPIPFKQTLYMPVEDQYKRVSVVFDARKFDAIELLHITDIQFGHKSCNEKRMIEYRDWVLDEPNRFMLWGGDLVDAGTKISVGSPWEQKWEPQGQLWKFCELWAPARHRVLGYVGGNHERRSKLTFGDLGVAIASVLGVPYSDGQQLLDVYYGQHTPFRISMWHGAGHASTPGAKLNVVSRFMEVGDSQLYLVGHLHEPLVRFYARPIRQDNGKIKLIKVGGAMSSSFLDYWGSYAEVANLKSAPLMMARAILEPTGHWELTLR